MWGVDIMSEQQEGKKVSLAEAAKQMLAQKKQAQQAAKGQRGNNVNGGGVKHMKSQTTKKANNQSRKIGI